MTSENHGEYYKTLLNKQFEVYYTTKSEQTLFAVVTLKSFTELKVVERYTLNKYNIAFMLSEKRSIVQPAKTNDVIDVTEV